LPRKRYSEKAHRTPTTHDVSGYALDALYYLPIYVVNRGSEVAGSDYRREIEHRHLVVVESLCF